MIFFLNWEKNSCVVSRLKNATPYILGCLSSPPTSTQTSDLSQPLDKEGLALGCSSALAQPALLRLQTIVGKEGASMTRDQEGT